MLNCSAIPVLSIVGATGTGKTALSLDIAEALITKGIKSAIINVDSRQIYSAFPVLSAQPSKRDKERVTHYLYGYLPLETEVQAGSYANELYALYCSLHSQGIVPILVGGTGMYFQALFSGIASIPEIPLEIREEQRAKVLVDKEKSYKELMRCDAIFASTIHSSDSQRIARGLEVYYGTGKALSQWHTSTKPYFKEGIFWGINIPMLELEALLKKRIESMVDEGAIEEVEDAFSLYGNTTAHGWSCIGAKEIHEYLAGKITYQKCLDMWYKNTRAYAKRQKTWFRNKHTVSWIPYTNGTIDSVYYSNSIEYICSLYI